MELLKEHLDELLAMKKYPETLYYSGNTELLKRKKVSIIGTRKPSKYTKELTYKIASSLSKSGVCIVSGGAMGVDAIAHAGATSSSTISVLPCGIDIKYPAVNRKLLTSIENNGLLLSQFEIGFVSRPWSFVTRNELVVALGEVLIVTEAELNSGSMRSIEYALEMKKEIFVLPHRLGESSATNELLKTNRAKAIYDIDEFVKIVNPVAQTNQNISKLDDFLEYCKSNPTYEEALKKYPQRVFEAELSGEIEILNAKVFVV